jgi:hypothetical protein
MHTHIHIQGYAMLLAGPNLKKHILSGSSNSNFIRNVFVNEFPRLAAVFEVLFDALCTMSIFICSVTND